MTMRSLACRGLAALLSLSLTGCAGSMSSPGGLRPQVAEVMIPVGSDELSGRLDLAKRPNARITAIWFHGFPGTAEPDPAAVDALLSSGINVLTFHYRGSWGAPGTFSAAHALEDARAAIAFLRTQSTLEAYGIDPDAIVPVGDSFGSWVAMHAAAADPKLPCAAGALVLNLGQLGLVMAQDEPTRNFFVQMFTDVDRDPALGFTLAAGADEFASELVSARDAYDLSWLVPMLETRPVLLIGARSDELAPVPIHLEPFFEALRAAGNEDVTQKLYDGGHELSNATYAGLLASWLNQNCR